MTANFAASPFAVKGLGLLFPVNRPVSDSCTTWPVEETVGARVGLSVSAMLSRCRKRGTLTSSTESCATLSDKNVVGAKAGSPVFATEPGGSKRAVLGSLRCSTGIWDKVASNAMGSSRGVPSAVLSSPTAGSLESDDCTSAVLGDPGNSCLSNKLANPWELAESSAFVLLPAAVLEAGEGKAETMVIDMACSCWQVAQCM